jgi:hypothetical protein
MSCKGNQDRDMGLVRFLFEKGRGWCLMWGFIFGGCFLVGEFEVLDGRFEDVSVKIVEMEAGIQKMGEEWACKKLWAPI